MRRIEITRTRAIVGGVVLLVLALIALSLRPEPIEVDVAAVTRGPLRVTVDAEGRTRVRDRYAITAPVSGRLERIALAEGSLVRRGDVVARIAPMPLDAQSVAQARARLDAAIAAQREAATRVEQARLTADHARRTAERLGAVAAAGGLSARDREQTELASTVARDDLVAAQARARAAAAEIRAAQAGLLAVGGAATGSRPGITLVRSPTQGRLLRVPERSERVVAAGAPILELGSPAAMEVVVDVLSTDAVQVCDGAAVELDEWGGDAPLRGRVRVVEPSAFTRVSALGVEEQRVNVVIDFVDAPGTLGDGFRVEARIVTWEGPGVVRVPASALFRDGDQWKVFVVREGRARLQSVDIGHRTAAAVEVVRGLEQGEQVVLFPSDRVSDGVRVRR
jgi:HlyD family secretion protein